MPNLSLTKDVHERLASEFRFAADHFVAVPDLASKMFYLSVFYAESQRQLNVHWDRDLEVLRIVIQVASQQIIQKPDLPDSLEAPQAAILGALDKSVPHLATVFGREEIDTAELYEVLGRIAEVSYVTSGNGHYLYQKGLISALSAGQRAVAAFFAISRLCSGLNFAARTFST